MTLAPTRTDTVTTIASRIRDRAARTPGGVAMREKHHGIWRQYTWSDYWEQALTVAHGLLA
ncbi:MAG TPA: hypothetical protein VK659_31605, partial [Asanoa sp.]|nr:hypothetical protein [Asanoa sp.]